MPQIAITEAEAAIQTALQNLAGQGVDSAQFVVRLTQPGGPQPHRQNTVAISGVLYKNGDVVVKTVGSNPVNQPKPLPPTPAPAPPVASTEPPAPAPTPAAT